MAKCVYRGRVVTAVLAVMAITVMLTCGCGKQKGVAVSDDEARQKLEQLSPEEQQALRENQEAVAATAEQVPTAGMSEERQQQVQQGLRLAIPQPPPAK